MRKGEQLFALFFAFARTPVNPAANRSMGCVIFRGKW